MEQAKEYYAFISYKREDERWAKWLQNKLEHYRFPVNLNGRTDLPKYIRPTFRDVTDLKPGLLAEEIDTALRNSQWLIVVCSPRSAQSPWVCKEAQTFIDLGRADHIIPFVIEGIPFSDDPEKECFPKVLLDQKGENELLATNINEMGRDAAAIKVVARMFDLRFDALWQRHKRAQNRKMLLLSAIAVIFLALGIGISRYVTRQKQMAEKAEQERLAQLLFTEYYKFYNLYGDHQYASLFQECQRIMKSGPIPDTLSSRFEFFLRMSNDALQSDTLVITDRYTADFPAADSYGGNPISFSKDGSVVCVGNGYCSLLDVSTGNRIHLSEIDMGPESIRLTDDKIYTCDQWQAVIYDRNTMNVLTRYSFGGNRYIQGSSSNGKRFLAGYGHYSVYDFDTGHLIRDFPTEVMTASINHDGSLVALLLDG